MARGKNFWEMPYDPSGKEPEAEKQIQELKNVTGFQLARVKLTLPDNNARLNVAEKRFVSCDFHGGLEKASFTNCEFLGCYFTGTHWNMVKFSKCRFQKCHFFHTDFLDCRFIESQFDRIQNS